MDLLLIRHALPVRIEGGDGPADPELSDEGWRQAGALSCLAGRRGDRGDGGQPAAAGPGRPPSPGEPALELEVATVDGLAEFDRNAPWYIPIEELKAADDPRWHAMIAGEWDLDPDEFQRSVVDAVDVIIADNPGRTVAALATAARSTCTCPPCSAWTSSCSSSPTTPASVGSGPRRSGPRSLVSLNETADLRFANRTG